MATERHPFRPDIEGLRGIAILLVVGFHAGVQWLAGGFIGVDVFFVLSGYFITALLVQELEETGRIDVTGFYGRRAARLLPVLVVVLLATLAAVMWLFAPIDRAYVTSAARAVALHAGNVEFARGAVDYFRSGENPLLHTWTLAVEQQFYLLWPMLLLLAAAFVGGTERDEVRRRLLYWIGGVGVLSFLASLVVTRGAPSWAFFTLPTRLWEFALGGVVALFVDGHTTASRRAHVLQVAGLYALGFALLKYDSATPYPGAAALLPALGAVTLVIGGHGATTRVSAVLAQPVLRWFGRHSYAWYLWHWPVIVIVAALNPGLGVWGRLAWSGVALGLAVLTHRYVEQPAREGRGMLTGIPQTRLLTLALGASIALAFIAHAATAKAERDVSRRPQKMFAAAREDHLRHDCWGTTVNAWKGPCEFGDRTARTTYVLLGDSHAEHWLAALDRAGREHGFKVVPFVKGGCPVAEVRIVRRGRLYAECTRFREAMVRRLIAMRPDGAIFSSWDHYVPRAGEPDLWQVSESEWRRGLRRTYERVSGAGIPIVAIRGTPRTWFDVPACLSRRAAGLPFARACTYPRDGALLRHGIAAQDAAARGLRVAFMNMNDAICATPRCAPMRDGLVIFTDDNHLTATFSRSLAPVLAQRLDAAFASLR